MGLEPCENTMDGLKAKQTAFQFLPTDGRGEAIASILGGSHIFIFKSVIFKFSSRPLCYPSEITLNDFWSLTDKVGGNSYLELLQIIAGSTGGSGFCYLCVAV